MSPLSFIVIYGSLFVFLTTLLTTRSQEFSCVLLTILIVYKTMFFILVAKRLNP